VPGYRHTKQRSTVSALSVVGRNLGVDSRTRRQNTTECDEGFGQRVNETHLGEPA
jgi:hypothetical protein